MFEYCAKSYSPRIYVNMIRKEGVQSVSFEVWLGPSISGTVGANDVWHCLGGRSVGRRWGITKLPI